MKSINIFIAKDNTRFDTEHECLSYESLCDEVDAIMGTLAPIQKDDNCDFGNGKGYIQHDELRVKSAKIGILELCKRYTDHRWIQQTIDDASVHPSYACRIIDECCPRVLGKVWVRFYCIDSSFREWGQPYYAAHPEEGTMTQLN